uniref:Cuticle protein n=1 Tax=Timema monikensis TaxID=170555 RepID=A0A7R9EH99_9NEOP|nr:unnamed protein product [Timema monikensis]
MQVALDLFGLSPRQRDTDNDFPHAYIVPPDETSLHNIRLPRVLLLVGFNTEDKGPKKQGVAVVLLSVFACSVSAGLLAAPASVLVRTPSLDSAVIKSDRLGGNFAYSSVEGHSYAAVSPVVQNVVSPVAVSYTAHQVPAGYAVSPAVYGYAGHGNVIVG